MASPDSMDVRKCRDRLHATLGLGYSHLSLVHCDCAYLLSTSLNEKIYLGLEKLSKKWHCFILGCLSSYDVMTKAIQLLGLNNTIPAGSVEKIILSQSHLQEWSRRRESKQIQNSTWGAISLKKSEVPNEDSHVLSMFYSTLASILPKKTKLNSDHFI